MAETTRYPLGNQLDIQQILVEAQHRWLRPTEICEILRNYKKFRISPEPAHMPPNGSLFLFDRKMLRYFRKDGHNWRKKKDGKTIKEAHERLKSGSIDVLHCYYAHGEENENFQRRSYWMLEEELSHIVLVHYREVKGNRTNFNRVKEYGEPIPDSQETEYTLPNSDMDTSVSSNFHPNIYQVPAQTVETTSMNSTQASEYEDAESVSSRYHTFLKVQPAMEKIDAGLSDPHDPMSVSGCYEGNLSAVSAVDFMSLVQGNKAKDSGTNGYGYEPQKDADLPSWEDVLESCIPGSGSMHLQPTFSSQADTAGIMSKQDDGLLAQLFTGKRQEFGNHVLMQEEWQNIEGGSSHLSKWASNQKFNSEFAYDLTVRFHEQESDRRDLINAFEPFHTQADGNSVHNDFHIQLSNTEHDPIMEGKSIFSSTVKQHVLDGSLTGLKKLDSFDRWMSKELGDVNEPCTQSGSGADWDTIENEHRVGDSNIPSQEHLDNYMLGPSLSQNQLFTIIDFSPNWVHVGSKIKVLITGRFLKCREEAENCKWSCMFGEIEVPAEVIADGVLRCHTPLVKAGRVPFYVTCSDRVACSEVREFEYRLSQIQDVNITDNYSDSTDESLHMRFVKMLCQHTISTPMYNPSNESEISQLSCKISSLLKEDNDGWDQMLKVTSEEGFSLEEVKGSLLQRLLKEKLYVWLLQKAAEGGKGPSVLDEGGQGVLHFTAALGYDWALEPTIAAGVKVNFRDVNGWTALHWAASCGRERTVASLILLGAAPGALTDPTPKDVTGRTPADLASANKHKGIAGYLAECALSSHLETLNLDKQGGDAAGISGTKTVTASARGVTPVGENLAHGSAMKDSLAAICNATQAAARICQVFRVQSFQKKQLKEYNDKMSDERALSLIALKTNKLGHDEPVHVAATQIQNKFRSWKGRKDFLVMRQQIIKIQAHVRGHQVRKNYKKIIWSVGIVEKIILRWRRKGSGLRGFKSEALTEGRHVQGTLSRDDDYDFFKEGRKQIEERSQIALARVKSMLRYPEARDQYTRLRTVATEIQETKIMKSLGNNFDGTADSDDMIDLETFLDDDLFMPTDSRANLSK